ncbi:unnamed protein product [Caenorhabditis auriculariae]|uniref:Uncharacterized protein n=1 Tax=Caenorhabditis auriculariae TaxID=2777116 RepID=A0A8S1HYQ1_9PELO|nr:unnamed protein product [Caenorhabditis auriculariae]
MLRKMARSIAVDEQRELLRVILACALLARQLISETKDHTAEHLKDLRMSVCDRVSEKRVSWPKKKDQSSQSLRFSVVKVLVALAKFPSLFRFFLIKLQWNTVGQPKKDCFAFELLLAPLLWSGRFDLMLRSVRSALIGMVQLADEPLVQLPSSTSLQVEPLDVKLDVNLGTTIVLKKLEFLLDFLAREVENDVKTTQKPSTENMNLLNRISDFVNDSEMSTRIAWPLFSCVEKRKCQEELLMQMLNTLGRIAQLVENPQEFIHRIAPLCSKINGRNAREALVGMAEGFAKSPKTGPRTRDILRLFGDLEAWDKSKVDEPNFDRRYNAYSKLAQIWLGDEPLDTSILSIFIHTHMHLISNTSDMSLRMAASNNLRSLISFAGRTLGKENANQNTKKNIVDGVFSPLFVQAMRSENEAVRDETLNCFAALVDAFPEHAILSQYVQLRSTDSDVDFLENMNHIQVHRRQRAMYRLVEGIKTNKISMDFPAMNKFLVPMVSPYLINTQSKTSALSDEALRVLNVVMSHAPWPKYVSCLEFWLSRVEKHSISSEISDRALVRVLVSVIDAFHFDLTTPDESMETEEADENAEPTVEQEPETEKPEKDHRLSILERVTQKILPRLTRCLNAQTEAVERNARTLQTKLFAEDFDIQRAPMALATVKMLKKLPEELQNQNLHGVVLKLCHLMISRSHSVRESARKIAIQVSEVLGPKYLPFIIREMQLVMTKGFQVHVVIFSVHTLIISQKENLKVGDLDTAVDAIMKLCADVPEAKANRTPETLAQLGRVVSAAGIEHVLEPLRKVVDAKPSAKVITRVSDLLSKFVLGLKENDGISPSLLLNYIFQSLTGDIKKMQDVLDRSEESDVVKEHGRRPQSCLILPKAPKRIGAAEKTVVKSRVHVFAEFSAQLLAALLYAKRLDPTEPETISRLNPFVKIVLDCLKFKYDKLITHSLRALASMIQMQLPAIKNHLPDVSNTLFVLLAEYSSLGSVGGKASIQQLSQLLYKTFTKLISYAGSTWLTQENLSLLLAYAEVDVLDQQKQSTMFSLLKILVRKGVRHERLPEIMHHLSETAIRSPIQSIRTQCRETLIDFIGGASDELKKPEKHIEFFLDQLDYEYEDGRLSAAEMLKMLFTHLLPKTLTEVHMLCTVKMGAALVNDDSPKCATLVALGLRQLLTSVGVAQRQEVFEAICQWLEADDENARSVGLQVVMQLSAVEKDVFAARMAPFMDRVLNVVTDDEFFDNNSESTLVLYAKCITTVLSHAGPEAVEHFDFDQLFDSLEQFVKCEDELSVRREGCRLLGQVLAMMSTSRISGERAKVVVDWMSRVIRHPVLDAATAEQASKSIVFVSKHLEDDSFAHLIAQIAQACRFEIKNQPKAILKRSYCFKLSLALALSNEARSNTAINAFFPLFVREITGKSQKSSEELVTLTNEICEVIKKKIGEEDFGRRTAQAQQDTAKRAAERKRKIKELAVTAPEDAAELKRRRNRKKLEVRKRKLDVQKPYRIAKRRHQEKMKAQMDEED